MPGKWLTKSKYLNGLQCPRLLWLAVNQPSRIPEPDAATQQVFDQGHVVGDLAHKLFPDGIAVPDENLMDNIRLAKQALRQRKPLFESGILSDRLYSRVDILNPVNEDEWDIIEVKSATSVKDVNIDDAAFQKLVCQENGLKINRCFLACINSKYVRYGEVDPQQLFNVNDITDDVAERSETIRDRVAEMFRIMDSPNCPEPGIGPYCNKPYECKLEECWGKLPEHSVFTMYSGGLKAFELYRNGILEIKDIPDDFEFNGKQQIQYDSVSSDEVHLDKDQIREFLYGLVYPLYYLDFETIGPAVPLYDNSRPYQNIPFQYSLHIQKTRGAKPEHYWFLAEGDTDPRPALMESLHKVIQDEGSIIAYNKSFEERVLRESAEVFSEYTEWVEDVNSRMIDLIVPFRNFHYYSPAQKGSASLKYVLPAITGKGYQEMDIGEGGEASRRFLDIVNGKATPAEVKKTRKALLEYCGQDTEGMVWIMDELWNMVAMLL